MPNGNSSPQEAHPGHSCLIYHQLPDGRQPFGMESSVPEVASLLQQQQQLLFIQLFFFRQSGSQKLMPGHFEPNTWLHNIPGNFLRIGSSIPFHSHAVS